ncbi:hypothetical protein ACWGRL_04640 [[Kitasatospora] papulosa]
MDKTAALKGDAAKSLSAQTNKRIDAIKAAARATDAARAQRQR